MNREHWYSKMMSCLTNPEDDERRDEKREKDSPAEEGKENYPAKLELTLEKISRTCAHVWNNRAQLDVQLTRAISKIDQCCYIYAINSQEIR